MTSSNSFITDCHSDLNSHRWIVLDSILHSSGLSLSTSATKHRCILATKSIPVGSTVLSEPAMAFISLGALCEYCLSTSDIQGQHTQLQRCTGCRQVVYCSVVCQKADWIAGHNSACAVLKTIDCSATTRQSNRNDIAMLFKVVRIISNPSFQSTTLDDRMDLDCPMDNVALVRNIRSIQPLVFLSLQSHVLDFETCQAYPHATNALNGHSMKQIESQLPSAAVKLMNLPVSDLIHHLGRFRCNNFTIIDSNLFPVGEGTYPLASLFNHDCWPNCIAIFDGSRVVIQTIRDIAKGDELCISYIDPILDHDSRRMSLETKYCFNCQCSVCMSESCTPLHSPTTKKDALLSLDEKSDVGWRLLKWFHTCLKKSDDEFERAQQDQISKTIALVSKRAVVAEIGNATRMFQSHLMRQDWEQAYKSGLHLLGQYLLRYPRYYPLVSQHMFFVAQCMWNSGQTDETIFLLGVIKKCLEITYGSVMKSHHLIGQVDSLLAQALYEQSAMV
ncbi:hypothetical protein QVD99_007444 [Batrachochytrium dendrobatidis]|nr:hypothetical protein O5D80_008395 [Batrachochytrium dendrobatidis]KAK5665815.1 hypothetical protein QVD99_007444 [Batrachochytrium dendrobatidis]